MRVIHLSTYDQYGGAALAAARLHAGLRALGHESTLFARQKRGQWPETRTYSYPMGLSERLRRRVRRFQIARDHRPYRRTRPNTVELFTDDRTQFGASAVAQIGTGWDAVHLHWVSDFVDYGAFFASIPQQAPVVWTLHDMNAFTGGCHYDGGCGRFAEACGACPQLGSQRAEDLSHAIWQRKAAALANVPSGRLHIVTPSNWLAEQVRRSSLLGRFLIQVIPNGVDTETFAPLDRSTARAALRLPLDARVALFLAAEPRETRKGFTLLQQALTGLRDQPDLWLLSAGGRLAELPPIPNLHLGRIEHPRLLALAYCAADVFVIPSLQDNLPNTVLEALACGTPVLAFEAGGIPDMVRPGSTGVLVPAGQPDALRDALITLLDNADTRAALGQQARKVALAEYTLERQAHAYAALYESLEAAAWTSR